MSPLSFSLDMGDEMDASIIRVGVEIAPHWYLDSVIRVGGVHS
jgi:hypothetical protein